MPVWTPPAGAHVTYSRQRRRCRKPACSLCRLDGPGHGPYWFAYWREGGKLRSRYLGKQLPPGVEEDARAREQRPAPLPGAAPLSIPQSANPAAPPLPPPAETRRPAPALRIQTLGGLAIWRDRERLPTEHWRPRVLALLTCLLSAPGCRLHREQVLDALWPETEPESAMRNLHATLHLLRLALHEDGADVSMARLVGELLVLSPADSAPACDWLDAAAFDQAARAALDGGDRAACREALALYGGDYVPEEPYTEWVVSRREELRARRLALLLRLADLSSRAGEYAEAEGALHTVLTLDPCHEDAAGALMSILAAQGRRAEALRVYHALATAMETDLGLLPADEIEALRARVQAREAAPSAADLAPRAALPSRPGNLPAPITSFVGRDWEVTELGAALARPPGAGGTRLLSLVGPGGCGKSRLALAVAANQGEGAARADGVWLVELAALDDARLVARTVASALGLREGAETPLETLRAFLRPRGLLLLLDNCEHLADACAPLVTDLLAHCPGLAIMTTSRKALGVLGEMVWRVPPLATPPLAEVTTAADLVHYEATRLFLERARAARPTFALSDGWAPTVARLCRRLDGLPLAIELAAARMASLPLEVIAARLDDSLALLQGGNRAALPHQQTLQATMDWSYALLSEAERVLLRRLAVFAGGATLAAIEAVCADAPVGGESARQGHSVPVESAIGGEGIVDLLSRLVAQSLALLVERGGEARYGLLETVRQYARAHLAAAGEEQALCARQYEWFLAETERAFAGVLTEERDRWLDRLEADLDNLRVTLAWSIAQADGGLMALRLATAIGSFWLWRGYLSEGARWLSAALAAGADAPALPRARALNLLGSLANERGESRQALAYYEQSERLSRSIGDQRGVASALVNQGNAARYLGEFMRARALYEQANDIFRELGDRHLRAVVLNNLGGLCNELGEQREAVVFLEECLALKRALGNTKSIGPALGNLAEARRMLGDLEEAAALYDEFLTLSEHLGDRSSIALARHNLGVLAMVQGDLDRAATLLHAGLALARELGSKRYIALCLESLAGVAARRRAGERALRLFGAAAALRDEIATPVAPADHAEYERDLAFARSLLGPDADQAWRAGRSMGLEAAIAEALRHAPD